MFSGPDIAVIVVVALLIFGPGKLPEIGKSLGKGIRDFKKAVDEPSAQIKESLENNTRSTLQPPAAAEVNRNERA